MRILHAPTNIAGQPGALVRGLRDLGHEAENWHFGPNPFEYPADRLIRFPPAAPSDIVRIVEEALGRFDIFHFHFARSLVPRQVGSIPGLWDLPLYRALDKRVFFTFHGSDCRLKSVHMAENKWSYYRCADVRCDEDDIMKRLNIIRTYADGLFVCSPINKRYVEDAGFHGRAIVVDDWPFVGPSKRTRPLVVHVPSARGTKGSDVVQRVVREAEDKGLPFEFRLLEGIPHREMKAVLSEADVVVDNLLLGDYEVTGLEALCLGKTVITRMDDVVAKTMGGIPILNADPDTFVAVLERAVTDATLRERLAGEGRAFVEKHHDAKVVAQSLIEAYQRLGRVRSLSFPAWAALGEYRREENLEKQILDLQTALRTRPPTRPASPRGFFARLGGKIDAVLRRIVRRLRRKPATAAPQGNGTQAGGKPFRS
ncbi:MAG: glycosyltransferase family 4 protein [Actinomycetota bacterium]